MKRLLFTCLSIISFVAFSQRLPFCDDYFSVINPASNFNRGSNANFISYSGLHRDYLNIGTIAQYKHSFGRFNIGILGMGNINSSFMEYSSGTQIGYTHVIRKKFALTTALGARISTNNFNFSTNNGSWNPLVFGLDAGLSLESQRWTFGVHLKDLNQSNYSIGTFPFTKQIFWGLYSSYRFKLDSLGKYELRPTIFYQQNMDNNQRMLNIDLRFKFNNHAVTIGTGLGGSNFIIGYSYRVSRWTFGPSLNFDFGKLSRQISTTAQFHFSYTFRNTKKNIRPPLTN